MIFDDDLNGSADDFFGMGGMLYNNPEEVLRQIKATRAANFDGRDKNVGDRVHIWDFSGCFDIEGNEIVTDILVKKECIVVETDVQQIVQLSNFSSELKQMDLMVFCPKTNQRYITASDFVRRLDNNN